MNREGGPGRVKSGVCVCVGKVRLRFGELKWVVSEFIGWVFDEDLLLLLLGKM